MKVAGVGGSGKKSPAILAKAQSGGASPESPRHGKGPRVFLNLQ